MGEKINKHINKQGNEWVNMWTMINLKMTFIGMMDWDLGANTIQGANMITSIKDYANFYPKNLFHTRNF